MRYEPSRQASVADMAQAREARAQRQRSMLARHPWPVISLTLNIPGPVKSSPLIREGFDHAHQLIMRALGENGVTLLEHHLTRSFTGDEFLYACHTDPLLLKRLTCALEEADAFGRLLDLDVLGRDGCKISRETVGLPPRACLLCGRAASFCAPARSHRVTELYERAQEILADTLMMGRARSICLLAQKSLIQEALVTPKPGLVDQKNSGAHRDMDLSVLLDSAAALGGCFEEAARIGISLARLEPAATMRALRPWGLKAEGRMFEATGGVNTHKGAIYALGILCAAAGRVWRRDKGLTSEALFDTASQIAADEAARLPSLMVSGDITNGIRLFAATGATGARGEAAAGFPAVRDGALPQLRRYLRDGHSLNDAMAYALIHLIPLVEDTSLMKRAGAGLYQEVQAQVEALLARGPLSLGAIRALDRQFIARNLSPGGCADLLAAACFAHWLEDGPPN